MNLSYSHARSAGSKTFSRGKRYQKNLSPIDSMTILTSEEIDAYFAPHLRPQKPATLKPSASFMTIPRDHYYYLKVLYT